MRRGSGPGSSRGPVPRSRTSTAIAGSPLNRQATPGPAAWSVCCAPEARRPHVYPPFNSPSPSSPRRWRARDDGVDVLVALPVYPLCGHSTTVAALHDVRRALDELEWIPSCVSLSGWHHDPRYVAARAGTSSFVTQRPRPEDPDTILYFSAHGTPLKYLEAGSRYDRYVAEHCQAIATHWAACRGPWGSRTTPIGGFPGRGRATKIAFESSRPAAS